MQSTSLATNGIACACCKRRGCCIAGGRWDLADLCFDCQLLKIQGELGAAAKRGQVSPLSPYYIKGRKEFIARVRVIQGEPK